MVMAGKEATADGSVLVAHNNDLTGAEAALVEKSSAKDHEKGEVVTFPSGLEIPQAEHTFAMLVLRVHTGYAEGDAIAINEHQVAIGGGVALGMDQNDRARRADPLVKDGLTGGVRYTALQRCRTARECVEWIGRMYTRYGVTYPSGVAVADPNEVWYIEAGGGTSWAAVRIPDDAVWVQANKYRIGAIDFDDSKNFLCSPGLRKFARDHGLWDPSRGPFHFARAFGKQDSPESDEFSCVRRVWRGIGLLNSKLTIDPDGHDLPLHFVPEEKLTVQRLLAVLRDRYNGTKFDHDRASAGGRREFAIASRRTVHTDVVQLRGWLPADIGAVMWTGLSTASCALYVPFYYGIDHVPKPYSIGDTDYDRDSAFWAFRSMANLATPNLRHVEGVLRSASTEFEGDGFRRQGEAEEEMRRLHEQDPEESRRMLGRYTEQRAREALALLERLRARLEREIAANQYKW